MEIILSAYYIGWFTYFAQGNSNSLATVDIGAGYIGLGQNYWPVFVGLLTALATFSGPLFWLMEAVIYIHSKNRYIFWVFNVSVLLNDSGGARGPVF
jgi:ethanolaminephosphotransferase